MMYIVYTRKGFHMKESGVADYATEEEARSHMGPDDHLIPVENEAEILEYQMGRKRTPTYNKFGRR